MDFMKYLSLKSPDITHRIPRENDRRTRGGGGGGGDRFDLSEREEKRRRGRRRSHESLYGPVAVSFRRRCQSLIVCLSYGALLFHVRPNRRKKGTRIIEPYPIANSRYPFVALSPESIAPCRFHPLPPKRLHPPLHSPISLLACRLAALFAREAN